MPFTVDDPLEIPGAVNTAAPELKMIWEPALLVPAGLLAADGALDPALTVDAATERLRALLSPGALWVAKSLSADELAKPAWQRLGNVPRWQMPGVMPTDELTATVRAAWAAALPAPRHGWGRPVLRLQVQSCEDARRLQLLDMVESYLLVPVVEGRSPYFFYWRWPVRVGVAVGPHSASWLSQLAGSQYGELFEARIVEPAEETPFDLLLAGPDGTAPKGATCVLMVDGDTAEETLLAQGHEHFRAAAIAGVRTPDLAWFDDAIRELSHDQPLDVALRIAVPDGLIAGEANVLAWTAPRQWALEVQDQLDLQAQGGAPVTRAGPLRSLAVNVDFDAERRGTTELVRAVRSFETAGARMALERHFAQAAAGPRAKPPASLRRLIAEATARGKKRARSLLPEARHKLNVWIAIPQEGELAADQVFPDQDLPPEGLVPLTVHASCAALGLHASQEISLSMVDRSAPSTVAVFEFHTGAAGSLVDIKVLVTYCGRPLQEVHLVATVRARPVSADKIRLMTVPLSASPEPREETTAAEASLEVNGANLERSGSDRKVDLSQLRPLADRINEEASRVLAADDAPETLDHAAARKLLISLARVGMKLKRALAPLGIGESGTLSLLVDTTTDVLPLELAYDADAPDEELAELCEHRPGGTRVGEPTMCRDAGAKVVCPFGFWGQQRVIARTIRLPPDTDASRHPLLAPLDLRPVLYAAATRADDDVQGPLKPTQYLAEELAKIAGAGNLQRVASWGEWRDAVRDQHPQLLVVLGHTETSSGEMILEIGKDSWLKDPDVRADVLQAEGSPSPLVLLLACSTAVARDPFGGLPAAFTAGGAAAVVGTLTKMHGPHGARAAAAVVRSICEASAGGGETLGAALKEARRRLVEQGLLDGLLLVSHGEIDVRLRH